MKSPLERRRNIENGDGGEEGKVALARFLWIVGRKMGGLNHSFAGCVIYFCLYVCPGCFGPRPTKLIEMIAAAAVIYVRCWKSGNVF